MPVYGGPGVSIEYRFIAVAPFDAEHPIGSGKVVHYEPGQEFPGHEWGNAAFNLVEMGKAVRLAVNVSPAGGGDQAEVATPAPSAEPEETEEYVSGPASEDGESFPVRGGGGWYTLSDGSRVRGQEAAEEAQAALDTEE